MINLKFMNHAVEIADGNEFRLLYVIANTLSLKKEGRTKIYRDMLADKLGLSAKQITRLTNALVDKGLLKKDLVYEKDKSVNYYSLNLDNFETKSTSKVDKNVPLNKIEKDILKEKKVNNIEKNRIEEKKIVEVKKTFPKCEIEQSKSSTVEDGDCDWNTELIRLEAKMMKSSSVEELESHIKAFSNKAKAVKTLPSDFYERLEYTKELRDKLIWTLKAKTCYT